MKGVALYEQTRLQLSIEAANVFNHRNYEPPNMQVDSGGFGSITALQTAEGARPRSLELSGRITSETMRRLNYELDGKHRPAREIARNFIHSAGLQ